MTFLYGTDKFMIESETAYHSGEVCDIFYMKILNKNQFNIPFHVKITPLDFFGPKHKFSWKRMVIVEIMGRNCFGVKRRADSMDVCLRKCWMTLQGQSRFFVKFCLEYFFMKHPEFRDCKILVVHKMNVCGSTWCKNHYQVPIVNSALHVKKLSKLTQLYYIVLSVITNKRFPFHLLQDEKCYEARYVPSKSVFLGVYHNLKADTKKYLEISAKNKTTNLFFNPFYWPLSGPNVIVPAEPTRRRRKKKARKRRKAR